MVVILSAAIIFLIAAFDAPANVNGTIENTAMPYLLYATAGLESILGLVIAPQDLFGFAAEASKMQSLRDSLKDIGREAIKKYHTEGDEYALLRRKHMKTMKRDGIVPDELLQFRFEFVTRQSGFVDEAATLCMNTTKRLRDLRPLLAPLVVLSK